MTKCKSFYVKVNPCYQTQYSNKGWCLSRKKNLQQKNRKVNIHVDICYKLT